MTRRVILLVSCGSLPNKILSFSRWLKDYRFPCDIPLFQCLSSFVRESDISRNRIVKGRLHHNTHTLLPLIGIIVQECCGWLLGLTLVLLELQWVCVLDARSMTICKSLYPDVYFIDGFIKSLAAVDIFLHSRVSLFKCSITLFSTIFSLVITTSKNVRMHSGWKTAS